MATIIVSTTISRILAVCVLASGMAILGPSHSGAQAARGDRTAPSAMDQKVMIPYQISITPPARAVDSETTRLRPIPVGVTGVSQKTCAFSVRPAGGGPNVWQETADPTCAKEYSVKLPAGQFVVHLAVLWRLSGSSKVYNQAQDLSYEVRPGDRIKIRSLALDRNPVATNVAGKVIVEVENVGPVALSRLNLKGIFTSPAGSKVVRDVQIGSLRPGAIHQEGIGFFPLRSGPSSVGVEIDMANAAGEGEGFAVNNKATVNFTAMPGPPPTPGIQTGTPSMSQTGVVAPPGVPASSWTLRYSVCNIDPEAVYAMTLTCMNNCSEPGVALFTTSAGVGNWNRICDPQGQCPTGFSAQNDGRCPTNLPFPGVITGQFTGPISSYADHDFELSVQAEKKHGPTTFSRTVKVVHVPKICQLPPCTPTEGYRYEGVSIR